MKIAYTIPEIDEALVPACVEFEKLVERLQSEETAGSDHGAVEELIVQQGSEAQRLALQGHLDLRAAHEPRLEAVIGEDGVRRTHVRQACSRRLMTRFGEVEVRRLGYSSRNADSRFPLDGALHLPPDSYSQGLRQEVACTAVRESFDASVAAVDRVTAGHVPKRQAEGLLRDVSQDVVDFYRSRPPKVPEQTTDPLILTVDGKGVVMRPEDLREATRKAAAAGVHKRETRLSPGEKKNRKRMATVAAVYDIAPHQRTAAEVMGPKPADGPPPPKPRDKRVWASLEREPETVIGEVFAEAQRRDPEHRRDWVVLVDGQPHQLERVKDQARRQDVQPTIVLDIIHVLEYLWSAAHALFFHGGEDVEGLVQQWFELLLNGGAGGVAMVLRMKMAVRDMAEKHQESVECCVGYLEKYADYLHYNDYLQRGLPIASGVIEGACRHLVKDRLELTGARWSLAGAEAMLALRSVMASDDWKAYWSYHNGSAFERNHVSRYEELPWREAA